MAVSFSPILHLPHSLPSLPALKSSRTKISATGSLSSSSSSASQMDLHNQGRQKFIEFPFVSAPHRDLMVNLVSTVEDRLGSHLLPFYTSLDVQHCQNESGSAQASLHIRSGLQSSQVDFILGSWLHCKLPTGGALNITSLSTYLNPSTDAPNFMIELIQSSPTSLVLILDLPPRKDLALSPDYLQTFYENTQLDTHRQMLMKLPEVQPYVSSSLYLRSILSPTVVLIQIGAEEGGPERMEEIIKNHLHPTAQEVLGIWLDHCACGERLVGEEEKAYMMKRDKLIKKKTIEIDLGTNFPRLFGPELTDRVLGAIQKISIRKIRNSVRALSITPFEMEQPMRGGALMEFPHLLAPHKDLMVGLISALDKRLHRHLLPSSATVPTDAEYYQNQSGASQGTLCINRGVDSSPIDFILASLADLSLTNGGAMNITNIQGYLKSSTDAPHFQFELVQCSPTYFIFFLDLIPRKDLVLNPDYLKTFYEDSQLEALRKQLCTQVLEAKPYFSSSLYFRNVCFSTGIVVSITCEDGGTAGRAEEIIRDIIEPIANEVLEIWMDSCVCKGGTTAAGENERDQLEKRDRMIKSRAIEMDLSSSMPIQFGQEVADRVLGIIRGVFRI
uniref:Red chlorophyll catabolite reductase n=1 Tax=Salix viminalis TaxID=40686 RepID=A0A6N2MFR4_SALVM